MKDFYLKFEGYWGDRNKGGLPNYSGIYIVYRSVYNAQTDKVSLIEIIYIGKADNIHDRHLDHEKYEVFLSQLQYGEELCYSCAPLDKDVEVVENALIFAQKPVLNEKGKTEFNYDRTHVKMDGACACMKYTDFFVR